MLTVANVLRLCLIFLTFVCATHCLRLQYEFGPNVSPKVSERTKARLDHLTITTKQTNYETLSLHFGNTTTTRKYIPVAELLSLAEESFIIRTARVDNTIFVVIDGNPFKHDSPGTPRAYGNVGLNYGIYAALERVLQFAFYHPLLPSV
jgi:hypothetical protein